MEGKPDYTSISDRELLIRIDERQHMMTSDLRSLKDTIKQAQKDIGTLDKEKISKGSILWMVTLLGGFLGIVSTAYALITKVH